MTVLLIELLIFISINLFLVVLLHPISGRWTLSSQASCHRMLALIYKGFSKECSGWKRRSDK